jgi:hypothetical protein
MTVLLILRSFKSVGLQVTSVRTVDVGTQTLNTFCTICSMKLLVILLIDFLNVFQFYGN